MSLVEELTLSGIPVFPCSETKQPIVKGGFKSATTNPPMPWRAALIGVPVVEGTVILDVDAYKGVSTEKIDKVLGSNLDWEGAVLQHTPSGGAHYAFKIPEGVVIRQGMNLFKHEIGEGFDTRTVGHGYICTGGDYTEAGVMGVLKLVDINGLPSLPAVAVDALKKDDVQTEVPLISSEHRDIDTVKTIISHIPSDCDYETWRNVAMALKNYFHDDLDIGLSIWHKWSSLDDRYSASEADKIWGSIDSVSADGRSVTMGSVVDVAKKFGYVPPKGVDFGSLFSSQRLNNDLFNDLIDKIHAEAGNPGSLDILTHDIREMPLSALQREECISILLRARKDHRLPISKAKLEKACTPEQSAASFIDQMPMPKVCDFNAIPVTQINALSGNSGVSAGLIYDSKLHGRFFKSKGTYWWTGTRFQPVSESDIVDFVSNSYGRGEYAKRSYITATAKTLMSNCPAIEGLGQPDKRVFFKNCVIDPETNAITQHTPENKNLSVLTVDYNPSAKCPKWDAFIADIFEEEPERATLLYEQLGWLLCNSHLGIEKAILFHGESRAGKGTIIDVIYAILGSSVTAVKLSQLAVDKNLGSMRNASVAIDPDAKHPKGSDAPVVHANFNAITANEAVSIPLLYSQEPWQGKLHCKLMMACNEIPIIYDDSGAAPKRWLPLYFSKSFLDSEDLGLKNRLMDELEGVTLRILDGLQRLIKNNGKFSMPQSSLEQIGQLTRSSSPISEFCSEMLEFDEKSGVHATDVYNSYLQWASLTNNAKLSRGKFRSAIIAATRKNGADYKQSLRIDGKVNSGFKGMRLRSAFESLPDNVTPIQKES